MSLEQGFILLERLSLKQQSALASAALDGAIELRGLLPGLFAAYAANFAAQKRNAQEEKAPLTVDDVIAQFPVVVERFRNHRLPATSVVDSSRAAHLFDGMLESEIQVASR